LEAGAARADLANGVRIRSVSQVPGGLNIHPDVTQAAFQAGNDR
jgi:hypothetical protein